MLAILRARRRGLGVMYVLDAALAAAVGGLILARAAHVGMHWNYHTNHLRHALRLRDGGLAWQGALLGGTLGVAILCTVRKSRLLVTLDALTVAAAFLAIFAWLACFLVGCAYGLETFQGQGVLWTLSLDLPDLYGISEPRVAVQFLGVVWSALVLGATLAAQSRARHSGMVFILWLLLHSLGAFGLGLLRRDEMARIAGWRLDQLVNLALGVAAIGAMFARGSIAQRGSSQSHRKSEEEAGQ